MTLAGCLQAHCCTFKTTRRTCQASALHRAASDRVRCRMHTSASANSGIDHSTCSPPERQQNVTMAASLPRAIRRRAARCQAVPTGSVIEEAMRLTRVEKRDQAYRAGAVYLRTLGIDSQTELTRVLDIAMNPNSLFADHQNKLRASNASARLLSVDDNIRPVIEFLSSLGLSDQQIKQVVLEHPPVISYSPAEQLQPFLDGLRGLGIQDPLAVVVRRPSLLGLSLRDNVQRIVEYLKEAGNTMEQIEEMLATTI